MTRFLDGPAAGQSLMLRAAPEFLRVVHSPRRKGDDQWDALDQPGDEPKRGESVYAYRRVGKAGTIHLMAQPRSASGWYATATYRVIEVQPDAETLGDGARWKAWCAAHDAWVNNGAGI